MCRWIAYSGKPIYMDMLVTKPSRSLVDQSLNSRMSFKADGTALPTNGDGFGMGWYNSDRDEPGVFKIPDPAWSNENIHELCGHIRAPLFMAHIRAASTGAIQRTNAHPFKYGNWLFQHNGYIGYFEQIRRDLQFDIDPKLYQHLRGSTDSETFFLLALTYGLMEQPKQALERTIARVARSCNDHSVPIECVLSCALSDGKHLYTLRYATGEHCHSQYYSTHADCIKELNSGEGESMPPHSVVVVSEPLDQSMEYWKEMPVNSFATIAGGRVDIEELSIRV